MSKQRLREDAETGGERVHTMNSTRLGIAAPPGGTFGQDYCPIRAMHRLQKGEDHQFGYNGRVMMIVDGPRYEDFPSYGKV